MNKATDPFDEYLRKKKVEMLETKFRAEAEAAVEAEDDDFVPPSNDDPVIEAKVAEEVDDFFTSGQDAGAEIFEKAGSGLSEHKVEEIKDALDDVFEEDAARPQDEDDANTFVDFFRQVNDEYDPNDPMSVPPASALPPRSPAPALVMEDSAPLLDPDTPPPLLPPDPVDAEVDVAAVPLEAEAPTDELPADEAAEPTAAMVGDEDDLEMDFNVDPGEDTATAPSLEDPAGMDELVAVEVPEEPVEPANERITLNGFLAAPKDEEELLQRVELLGRFVAKLVERARLPESEIIEVLIRCGVEF